MNETLLYGREIILPKREIAHLDKEKIRINECIQQKNKILYCARCNQKVSVCLPCEICEKNCFYCTHCIDMGKMCECCCLCSINEPFPQKRTVHFEWRGVLSNEQERGSIQIIQAIQNRANLLISAVTGAGKTEMIFKGLHYALEQGYRVCVAAPRIDVCLELAPRIQAVFPNEPIIVLHGNTTEKYKYTKLVIATTHQLLKFKEAFDVLVIDEVDAFPFQHNDSLQKRVDIVVKQEHSLIFLTATPSLEQQRAIKKGELNCVDIPVRYHGFALPIPKFVYIGDWKNNITKKQLCTKLIKYINGSIKKQRKLLIFLPHIHLMQQLEQQLRQRLPKHIQFASVHAQDNERLEKVQAMRNQNYHFLLTTTILERGVTFSNIDVIVLGSEDRIFSTAALVQIAGRVGRKCDYPTGDVWFLHYGKTKAMISARNWIVKMNTLALKRGLIQ
ncbi:MULTISPECIES: DEAD/DEAH box helicase [unclassified Granulicatella]|uniref:DEAD/DEAH box helicase n=1 Tax=unclassified Granulicatella TaxID=2630493 RepID=UPI001073C71D|nr:MULTISPECIES: DEAD/DEAH box helicase [unclassified Granulicatella]MBF0779996.1 DEAD/DEAH box helicase family protein [Granulicatella sp. 19428wC4_WM01]TFU95923.1 DEAD/DEAH box helicase [Granulicatella sp. WM01]